MSTRLATIEATALLIDAAREMHERSIGAVLVMANEGVAGILTERDLLHCVATSGVEGASVADWMTRNPETIEPSDTTAYAASVMIHGGFRHLPVVEGGKPIGIVSIRDLMRTVLDDESPRGV